jgi:hypothetical protein
VEATVRYIPIETAVVQGKTYSTGNKPALCFRSETKAFGIVNQDDGIIPIELSLRDHDQSPLVMINNRADEYPVVKFITHLQRIIAEQNKPISSEALRLISEWPNNPADFDSEPLDPDYHPVVRALKSSKKKSNCIPSVAKDFKTTPQKVRKFLRKNGMHAPYADEKKIRELMKEFST